MRRLVDEMINPATQYIDDCQNFGGPKGQRHLGGPVSMGGGT